MSLSNFVSNFNRIYGPFKEWYSKINPANMTGAIDVIVIQQQDGTFLSSPFHVRFGKFGILKAKEKIVDIEVNEVPVTIHMKLDDNGAAYFVEVVDSEDEEEDIPPNLATSPIPQDSWLLMETNTSKKGTNSCSSSSSSSSLKSISRRRLEMVPLLTKKPIENTIAIQTDCIEEESGFMMPTSEAAAAMSMPMSLPESIPTLSKGKVNRKKRRQRNFSAKHSRNNSKTSLKELLHGDNFDDNLSTYNDEGDDETENDDGSIFVMEDEKEDFSDRTFVSATESRKNSSGSFRNNDEMDRAVTSQTPEGISFLLSRLPDQEKLDSILQHQAELEKQDLNQQVRSKLTVDISASAHYFSEPDMTPMMSPVGSRPSTPVLSDSELEVAQRVVGVAHAVVVKQEEQSWEWGQLPSTSVPASLKESKDLDPSIQSSSTAGINAQESGENHKTEQKSGEGTGWVSYFWRGRQKSEKSNGNPEEKHGIYLDDLKDDDAEMLQIYVGRGRSRDGRTASSSNVQVPNVVVDDDAESGNGPSLPMSPHSVEGAIGGPIFDHRNFRNLLPDIDISLCGGIEGDNSNFSTILFEQSKVTFDDFVLHLQRAEPSLFNSPDLVVRIGEQYFKWSAACPIIMSTILYGRTLPSDLVEVIRGSYQEPKTYLDDKMTLSTSPIPTSAQKKNSTSWWPFGSKREEEEEKKESLTISLTIPSLAVTTTSISTTLTSTASTATALNSTASTATVLTSTASTATTFTSTASSSTMLSSTSTTSDVNPVPEVLIPIIEAINVQEKEPEPAQIMTTRYSIGTQTEFIDGKLLNIGDENKTEQTQSSLKEKFRKTLRLSNEAISCLNLKPGMNEVQFSVTTAYQGTARCSCHLYLWKWSDKIVISDIDGTITKSDVLGHVLPVIGRDWAQSGVAELFTKIKNNGYHIAYLSARAIGQASFTKDYLASIRQGEVNLPDGPLLLNPTSLMNALHREVIEKKPEKFKIACLNDIKTLFAEDHNPFFAGYGNRTNDVIAYMAVGVPMSRIFTINPKGELRHEFPSFQTSYSSQSSIVDHIFPPLNCTTVHLKADASPTAQLEFSNFSFWREPMPQLYNAEAGNFDKLSSPSPSSPSKEQPPEPFN